MFPLQVAHGSFGLAPSLMCSRSSVFLISSAAVDSSRDSSSMSKCIRSIECVLFIFSILRF